MRQTIDSPFTERSNLSGSPILLTQRVQHAQQRAGAKGPKKDAATRTSEKQGEANSHKNRAIPSAALFRPAGLAYASEACFIGFGSRMLSPAPLTFASTIGRISSTAFMTKSADGVVIAWKVLICPRMTMAALCPGLYKNGSKELVTVRG